ncbi:MAG: hypothetical protein AMJ79_09800, partial [Phycisphaerae bacterium SM23_30]
ISGITLQGGYAGAGALDPNERNINDYGTILSGDLNNNDVKICDPENLLNEPTRSDNCYHVVTGSGTDETAVLDGFTITGGNASKSVSPNYYGGGLYSNPGSPKIINCTFQAHSAIDGGGMCNLNDSGPVLINCKFIVNWAQLGGAIYNYSSTCTLINCTLYGNTASVFGGGMYSDNGNSVLVNCIFRDNRDLGSTGTGETAQVHFDNSVPAIDYCCIQGWSGDFGGIGNIGADPQFVDADGVDDVCGTADDNLRLLSGSRCVDAGDNSVVPPAITDLNGKNRLVNDADTPDTGPTTAPIVDMGAYELPYPNYLSVDAAAVGNENGSSWVHAYTSLQDALAAATSSDVIQVAAGSYYPDRGSAVTSGDRTATFQLKDGVAIYGGFRECGGQWPERDPYKYETVLSGDLSTDDGINFAQRSDNSYHVVTADGTDATAMLDGFTITGGNANGSGINGIGGGMYNNSGDPTLTNLIFIRNNAEKGGGMYNDAGNPTLRNCRFSGNAAFFGGAIYNLQGRCTLINLTVNGNNASFYGGGLYNQQGHAASTNSIFWANTAVQGMQLAIIDNSTAVIDYCNFQGGPDAIQVEQNSTLFWGDGNIDIDPLFTKTGFWDPNGTEEIASDDFWVDGDYHLKSQQKRWDPYRYNICDFNDDGTVSLVDFAELANNWLGAGDNIWADLNNDGLVNIIDLHIFKMNFLISGPARGGWTADLITSRCIDAGSPGFGLAKEPWDEHNLRIDMGAFGGTAEARTAPADWGLKADLTNDGMVDLADYAALVKDWQRQGNLLPADMNQDGTVNLLDLAYLCADWLGRTSWHNSWF